MKSGSLDQWRSYFRSSSSDIFDIIDHAIVVAAADCPKEFKLRRDGIAERLFSVMLNRCKDCEKVETPVSGNENDEVCKRGFVRNGGSKESKANCGGEDNGVVEVNPVSNYTFGDAEALTDELEAESEFLAEVLRIKGVLDNYEDESDSVLFESLRRLQLMHISVDLLKSTEIGKAVNPLRKYGSKDVRQLARVLIDGWKEMVDNWVKGNTAKPAAEGGTPDSINPSVVENAEDEEEGGLPSPPLDDGAFFVSQPGAMELSQFFDGMDDDGNLRKSGPSNKNRENGRKPASDTLVKDKRNFPVFNATAIPANDNKSQQMKKTEAAVRLNKPVAADAGRGRPMNSNIQRKPNVEQRPQQKAQNGTVPKRPLNTQQEKPKCLSDADKLEATKRKLQERYQQAENAKRQRTIQVMEINELPKQGAGQRNTNFKPGNHNRQWANNGRR
ncbi:probable mediator of RNA polymerase II transcription subunit 26b [Vicia villosa]|uniref:probable mediator of RNA polymerase II transcription subunit 26b n=1 Tax=Vicia villosa TaxID=3911 RepID=UPI00273B44F1|nr:probable mediator of RNA polymerase II transcription subunit 26b [Vicia villosa]XP_058737834.1 probable mediator of RNA polymerase II transcription subunit 26b [Vicia villosa]